VDRLAGDAQQHGEVAQAFGVLDGDGGAAVAEDPGAAGTAEHPAGGRRGPGRPKAFGGLPRQLRHAQPGGCLGDLGEHGGGPRRRLVQVQQDAGQPVAAAERPRGRAQALVGRQRPLQVAARLGGAAEGGGQHPR
jgi:hypothetical protein